MAGNALLRKRTGLIAYSPAGRHAMLMTSNAISGQKAIRPITRVAVKN